MLLIILASLGTASREGTTSSRAVVRRISFSARLKAAPYPVPSPADPRFRTQPGTE